MSVWTETLIAKLRTLWGDGFSASKIAARFKAEDNVFFTSSAVIGKVHRLGLQRRAAVVTSFTERKIAAKRAAAIRADKPKKQKAPPALPVQERELEKLEARAAALGPLLGRDGKPVASSLFELKNGCCKWPIGDPARNFCVDKNAQGKSRDFCVDNNAQGKEPGFAFCARAIGPDWMDGAAYCLEHRRLAYDPAKRIKSLDGFVKHAARYAA